jgi:enoyl-CoA hydratase/carnithine racemase
LLGGAEFAGWRDAQPPRNQRDSATPVLVADDGETLTITLNRPEVHNAYDARTRDALTDALRSAAMLGERRTVELRGNGPSFCSGGDLSEFGTNHDLIRAHLIRTARSPGLLLHGLGARAVAHVHGACIGAGTELPAFCARVTARGDATFQLPEVAMGLIPGAGGTVSVTRRIGRQRTAWLAVSGSVLDASTAQRWGLVDALVD